MAEPGKKRRRALRIILRVLAWTGAVLAGLLLLGWLGLLVFFPDEKIRRLLCERLGAALGVPVEAGRLELSLLHGVELSDVRIGAPAGFEGAPLELGSLRVEHSLRDLIRGRIHLRDVELVEPRLRLSFQRGTSNLGTLLSALSGESKPQPEAAAGGKLPWLELERVRISDGAVDIEAAGLRAAISALRLSAALKLTPKKLKRLELSLELDEPARLQVSLPAALGRLEAHGTARLSLQLRQEQIRIQGSLSFPQVMIERPGRREQHRLEGEFSGWLSQDFISGPGGESQQGLFPAALQLERARLLLDDEEALSFSAAIEPQVAPPARLSLELRLPEWLVALGGEAFAGAPLAGQIRLSSGRLALDASGQALEAGGVLQAEQLRGRLGSLSFERAGAELRLDWKKQAGGVTLAVKSDLHAGVISAAGTRMTSPRLLASGKALLSPGGGLAFGPTPLHLEASLGGLEQAGSGLRAGQTTLSADWEECTFSPPSSLRCGPGHVQLESSRPRLTDDGLEKLSLQLQMQSASAALPEGQPVELKLGTLGGRLVCGTLEMGGFSVQRATAEWGAPALELRGKTVSLPQGVTTRLEAEGARGMELAAERLSGNTRLAPWISGSAAATLAASLRIGPLKPPAGVVDEWHLPEVVTLEFSGRLGRTVEVERLGVELGDLLSLAAEGRLDPAAGKMAAKLEIKPARAERLLDVLPPAWSAKLPRISGGLRAQAVLSQEPPTQPDQKPAGPDAEVSVFFDGVKVDWPQIRLKLGGLDGQAGALLCLPEPLPARAGLELKGDSLKLAGTVSFARAELKLAAETQAGRTGIKGDVKLSGTSLAGYSGAGLEEIRLGLEAGLLGRKELLLDRLLLQAPAGGLSLEVAGKALAGTGQTWWRFARLSARAGLVFDSPRPLYWSEQSSGSGRASASVQADVENDLLRAEGEVSLEDFCFATDGLRLSQASGKFPLSALVRWSARPELIGAESRPAAASGLAYRTLLGPLRPEARYLQARRLDIQSLPLENLRAGAVFRQGALEISGLRLGLLGGDVVADAQLVLLPPERRSLRLDAEMTGVDVTRLPGGQIKGDGVVGGNLRLELDLGRRLVSGTVELHRIGAGALLALLAAADPERTDEGIQGLRELLDRYGVAPRRLRLQVRHGLLDLEILFDLGAAARTAARLVRGFEGSTFRLRNLPVSSLLNRLLQEAPETDTP